jgi:long-chain fatty acid transport protein
MDMRMLSRTVAALAAILVTCLPLQATDGLLQIGYGSKSKGMGGVGVALPQDSFASAMNPAGLTLLCSRGDVGLHARLSDIHTESFFDEGDSAAESFCKGDRYSAVSNEWDVWPELGAVWGPCCDQWFGLAFYTVGEASVRYRGAWFLQTDRQGGPEAFLLPNTRTNYAIYAITPSWAWQISCVHSVGLALNATFARLKVDGLHVEDLPNHSTNPDRFTNRGGNWAEGVSLRLGWTAEFLQCLRIGVTYQTKTYMSHFTKYEGLLPNRGDADLPGQFGFGIAYNPTCDLLLSADVIKVFWRDGRWFRDDYVILENVGDEVEFGTVNGPGLGWNQQLILKLGLAWNYLECLTLRGGFVYGNSPTVAGNPLNSLLPETVNQHFTFGFTYDWSSCSELSLEYVHGRSQVVSGPLSPLDDDSGQSATGNWRQWQRSFGVSWGHHF